MILYKFINLPRPKGKRLSNVMTVLVDFFRKLHMYISGRVLKANKSSNSIVIPGKKNVKMKKKKKNNFPKMNKRSKDAPISDFSYILNPMALSMKMNPTTIQSIAIKNTKKSKANIVPQ